MADKELLTKLHDIHLPKAIAWWPLAPGWYLLTIILLALLVALVYYFRRRYLNSRPRQQALQLLARYQQEYQKGASSQQTAAKISELLRRVALVYFSREQVASLQGEAWLSFLNHTAKSVDFNKLQQALIVQPYQTLEATDLEPLFTATRTWIKQRGRPCLN